MMNKNKIIGLLVATAGVVASISTAAALYTKAVDPVGFGIGAATYSSSNGIVTYTIGGNGGASNVAPTFHKADATAGVGAAKFSEVNRAAKYTFQLGASYAAGLTAQDYVVGNLSVSLTNVAESIREHVEVSMYFDGYTNNTLGKVVYGSNLTSSSTAINETTITGASLSVDSRDICVAAAGTQSLVIYFKLDNTIDTLTMNELNNLWTLSVTWAAPSNEFHYAYIANNKVEWAEDDEFVMAPNISKAYSQASDFEWWGQIKGTAEVTAAKCRQGATWENSNENHALTLDQVYNVSWSGSDSAAATFSARP